MAVVAAQAGIAARHARDIHHFPPPEVERPDVGRDERRAAELLQRRRALLMRGGCDHAERAEGRRRTRFAAEDRQSDVDLCRPPVARELTDLRDAADRRPAVEPPECDARLHARRQRPGRQVCDRTVQQQVGPGERIDEPRRIAPPHAAGDIGAEDAADAIIGAGNRPLPLPFAAAERGAEMRDRSLAIPPQHLVTDPSQQAVALVRIETAVQRRGRIARHPAADQAVDRDLFGLGQQGPQPTQIGCATDLDDIPIAFTQHRGATVRRPQADARIAAQRQIIGIADRTIPAALSRCDIAELPDARPEIGEGYDVHDLLVGAIAILQRELFGEHLHPLDRLGGNARDFRKVGDASAVEQRHRRAVATPAVARNLRPQRLKQRAYRVRTIGPQIDWAERALRGQVADHGAPRLLRGDDDIVRRVRRRFAKPGRRVLAKPFLQLPLNLRRKRLAVRAAKLDPRRRLGRGFCLWRGRGRCRRLLCRDTACRTPRQQHRRPSVPNHHTVPPSLVSRWTGKRTRVARRWRAGSRG
ncbi:hypothetical protein WR25_26478 [Diploscapter pachys]|uniref:Uncharacterized protein n=1 Tax=Diploscapter pachys TaxID=2018661 RepID=A0A2A2JZK8_9BILA|nr:hypothetical protein WR25_26478 [Diploscapter pachys]